MADAWGGSWGTSWGVSWGAVATPAVAPPAEVTWPGLRRSRRRTVWIRLPDDRLIEVPAEAAAFAISALRERFAAEVGGKTPETPELAPAARKVAAALARPKTQEIKLSALVPELEAADIIAEYLRLQLAALGEDEDLITLLLLTA